MRWHVPQVQVVKLANAVVKPQVPILRVQKEVIAQPLQVLKFFVGEYKI